MVDRDTHFNGSVTEFLDSHIPMPLWQRLRQEFTSAEDLEKVVVWREDVAHQVPHILETMGIFRRLSEAYEIGPKEQDWGMRAIKLHDSGNRLVQKGVIEQKDHHLGSLFIASILDPDVNVLKAINLHVCDILPKKVPLWLRLVRDADRISSLGFTGANRLSTFFGHNGPKWNLSCDIKSGIYCELGTCPDILSSDIRGSLGRVTYSEEEASGYEKKAERYFIHKVLPNLYRNGKLKEFCDHMKDVYSWYVGTNSVEPVVDKAHLMYSSRAAVTRNISTIYHRVTLFPGGSLKKLENANLSRERKILSEVYHRPHISYR